MEFTADSGKVAQRLTRAEEVEAGIGKRDGFRPPLDELHTRQSSASHHAGTRIDAHHQAGITHQLHGFARHQTGADADVDDPHARFQPCSLA